MKKESETHEGQATAPPVPTVHSVLQAMVPADRTQPRTRFGRQIVNALRIFSWMIATALWTVFGFVFWVPFLARMIAVFSVAVVASAFLSADSARAERGLDYAIGFYILGFETTNRILQTPDVRPATGYEEVRFKRSTLWFFFWNTVYTAAFWLGPIVVWSLLT